MCLLIAFIYKPKILLIESVCAVIRHKAFRDPRERMLNELGIQCQPFTIEAQLFLFRSVETMLCMIMTITKHDSPLPQVSLY